MKNVIKNLLLVSALFLCACGSSDTSKNESLDGSSISQSSQAVDNGSQNDKTSSSKPAPVITYNNTEVIEVIESISMSLFESSVYDEDYFYDSDYDLYYTAAVWGDDATIQSAIKEAVLFVPGAAELLEEATYYSSGDYYYAAYYLGDVIIELYSYEDEDEGVIVEYDVYLYDENDTGDDDPDTPTPSVSSGVTTDAAGNTVATISFIGFSTETSVAFASTKVGAITVSASVGSGSNDPLYYSNGDALRLYAKNTLTIKADSGVTMLSIVFTSEENAKTDISQFTVTGGTYSASGLTGTTTNITSNTVKYTVKGDKGHIRIQTIEITYK